MTDSTRFEKFIAVMPEEKIRVFADDAEFGELSEEDGKMFAIYDEYMVNISSQFLDPNLQKAFTKFNNFFEDFINFYESELRTRKGRLAVVKSQYEDFKTWASKLQSEYQKFVKFALSSLSNGEQRRTGQKANKIDYDERSKILVVHGKSLPMRGRYRPNLMKLLASDMGRVFSYNEISLAVYKIPIEGRSPIPNQIDKLIVSLSKALRKKKLQSDLFIRNNGYGFKTE